jgi:tetrahydromethanopterin S-methyltransferase subunit B
MARTSITTSHTCAQEGPISALRADVEAMKKSNDKVEAKIDDILQALHLSNEGNKVKNTELYEAFKSIEKMLSSEAASRYELAQGQNKIQANLIDISYRVNKIETNVDYMKQDMVEAKSSTNALTRRVSVLEKVSYFVYALGAIIVAGSMILIYGSQLMDIIRAEPRAPTTVRSNTDNQE